MNAKKYTISMRDDCGAISTVELDARPTIAEIDAECDEWCRDGEWGAEGASITVGWALTDGRGVEIGSGSTTVEIEPDHDALIRAAGGDATCEHDWTREGEGGCNENPGVWSTGGTSLVIRSHCRRCGLRRAQHLTGSQRNPGERDTVSYEVPSE